MIILRAACLTLLLSFVMMFPAQAQPETPYWRLASNSTSLDAAVNQVRQQTGGRILTAETITRNGSKVHRIKVLLPDGTVKVILINAE